MKNKRLIKEQTVSGLDKFFYPGCFTAGDADTDPTMAAKTTITINQVKTPAIKKKNSQGKMVYYTENGKAYTLENGTMTYMSDWSCKDAPGKATANPAVTYFNKLGLDLTQPSAIMDINDAIREISLAVKNGGTGKDIRNFIYYVKQLKKDPTYATEIESVTETPDGPIEAQFEAQMGRKWVFADPADTEMPRFTKKTMKVGNSGITYYSWNAGRTVTKAASQYSSTECYQFLTDYIDRVDRGEISNIDELGAEKQTLFACYNPFWYDNKLNDENRTGTRELGVKGKQRRYLEKLLPQLLQSRGETGVGFGDGTQKGRALQYESLESRLRKALFEAVDLKKKRLLKKR